MDFSNAANLNLEYYLKESYGSVDVLIGRAKKGEIACQTDLGAAYCEGVEGFVEKDTEKAIGWLDTAVENGCFNPMVLHKLGTLLDLTGEPHNQEKAYGLFHKAARLGNRSAQLDLAEMYRSGVERVVNKDIKEAFEWYKKAAGESTVEYSTEYGTVGILIAGTTNKLGNDSRHKALTSLYKYYFEGACPEGKPQPTKAVHYLARAAELGNTEAQLNLGKIYLNGSCEQIKDLKKAKRWLEKASAGGNVEAVKLLPQCKLNYDLKHDVSGISTEAWKQSFQIMREKFSQRAETAKHPLVISNPVAFSEEMLCSHDWSPTARIHLQAYKLVKEGLTILRKSNFTDERGISLIAHGYLTENSILQAFPMIQNELLPNILQLCSELVIKNPCFLEGLLLSYALIGYERAKGSEQHSKRDTRALFCLMNLIHLILKAEPNSPPCREPFEFDKNYSSWLHVLYFHLGQIYTITGVNGEAAEASENSIKCCPSYYEARRGLGYSLMLLYSSTFPSVQVVKDSSHHSSNEPLRVEIKQQGLRSDSKYDSWTAEQLRNTAVKVLNEYLKEAPQCEKRYPNACYYLANISVLDMNLDEFRKYFELGQDAEEKRLPFFDSVDLPLKDTMAPYYQLYANVKLRAVCGNRACTNKVKESDLKTCSRCASQKYCGKECQKADWKNHKASCTASKKSGRP